MSVKEKSLVGWTTDDWKGNFEFNPLGILDSFNAIYKHNKFGDTDVVKVRITIEEVK